MDHCITFQTIFISEMVNLTIQGICKNTKVSDTKRFK